MAAGSLTDGLLPLILSALQSKGSSSLSQRTFEPVMSKGLLGWAFVFSLEVSRQKSQQPNPNLDYPKGSTSSD